MKRQAGFTLIELMVSLAIVGILFATAVPIYHTWQQRAYGSEAAIMIKQIIDAEIVYFLEYDKFFPHDTTYTVRHSGETTPSDINVIQSIENNINLSIPTGHFLRFDLNGVNNPGEEFFVVTISSEGGFDLFKGSPTITASVNKEGRIVFILP